jgi:hypothetical protein
MSKTITQLGCAALATLALMMLPTAYADGVSRTNCFRGSTTTSCTTTWQRGTISPSSILSRDAAAREAAAEEERYQRWIDRCRPVIRHDQYGVARYVYAARGCEFGRTDGALIK